MADAKSGTGTQAVCDLGPQEACTLGTFCQAKAVRILHLPTLLFSLWPLSSHFTKLESHTRETLGSKLLFSLMSFSFLMLWREEWLDKSNDY